MRSNRSSVALAGDAAVSDAAVAGGGVVRFEELYRSCAADAWRVARSVTGNDHDASDAVADASLGCSMPCRRDGWPTSAPSGPTC